MTSRLFIKAAMIAFLGVPALGLLGRCTMNPAIDLPGFSIEKEGCTKFVRGEHGGTLTCGALEIQYDTQPPAFRWNATTNTIITDSIPGDYVMRMLVVPHDSTQVTMLLTCHDPVHRQGELTLQHELWLHAQTKKDQVTAVADMFRSARFTVE